MTPTTPIPVVGIPYYNRPDLLRRCLESIDYPVETVVVVDNSPTPAEKIRFTVGFAHQGVARLDIIRHRNAGVAASWNEIVKLYPAPWWLLVNNDIQFAPGDLARMARHVEMWGERAGALYGNHGASWWAVTKLGIGRVGLFDENLYPAYLEDCDWSYRRELLGVKAVNVPDCTSVHGENGQGSCTINATPELAAENARTHGRNFEYYRAKWGGLNGQETYRKPFNQPLPGDYWKFDPDMRAAQQWK